MSYSIDTFKNLCSSYPSWSSLETFLCSPEGGNLRVVGSDRYRILRYVKGQTRMQLDHAHWMRSVVWDTETNRPLCVAPPKAYKHTIPTGEDVKLLVQELLDGTMINAYCTRDDPNTLHIASRTQFGATGTFYSTKTFAELFDEALKEMGYCSLADLLSILPKPKSSEISTFFSFLLRHPEHRVVSRVRTPHVYLVHAGSVAKDGTITISEDLSEKQYPNFILPSFPITGFKTESDLDSFFKGIADSKGWFFQGLSLKDGQGHRWRMRNTNYDYLRQLRGSEATDIERFLRLRSQGLVTDYLKHYSEDRQTYWDLEQTLRSSTKVVFDAYCEVHKAHAKSLSDLPKAIQPCVFRLHSLYLSELKSKKESVLMKHAVDLVNKMPVFEQKRLLAPQEIVV